MIIQPDTNMLLDLQEITTQYPNMWILAGIPTNEVGKAKQIHKNFVLFAGAEEQEFNDFSKQNFEKYYKNETQKLIKNTKKSVKSALSAC